MFMGSSGSVARRTPSALRGAGVWRRGGGSGGEGSTHVDRQRPRVDGGLGPHGRLEPQLQLLPHVGARGRRTMLVGRLGEGRGAAGGGGAGVSRRAGGRAGGRGEGPGPGPRPPPLPPPPPKPSGRRNRDARSPGRGAPRLGRGPRLHFQAGRPAPVPAPSA